VDVEFGIWDLGNLKPAEYEVTAFSHFFLLLNAPAQIPEGHEGDVVGLFRTLREDPDELAHGLDQWLGAGSL
jgi:hypothetical protein